LENSSRKLFTACSPLVDMTSVHVSHTSSAHIQCLSKIFPKRSLLGLFSALMSLQINWYNQHSSFVPFMSRFGMH